MMVVMDNSITNDDKTADETNNGNTNKDTAKDNATTTTNNNNNNQTQRARFASPWILDLKRKQKEILNGNKTCARGRTCAFNAHAIACARAYLCVYICENMFAHMPRERERGRGRKI